MPDELIACHDCDLLHRLSNDATGRRGATGQCRRCGAVLYKSRANGVERTLALTLAGIILFVVANTLPFLSFDMNGRVTETTLASGVRALYEQGRLGIAALVLVTAVIAPALQLGLLAYVLLPLHFQRVPWRLAPAFRTLRRIQPWSMMEVFLIGIFVALVKLADMAEVVPGLALWSFAALIAVIAATASTLDPREIWKRVEMSR